MNIQTLTLGPLATNCYLVRADESSRAVIIDPAANSKRLLAALEEQGLTLEAILLTHAHFDHIGALKNLRAATNARVYIGEADKDDPSHMCHDLLTYTDTYQDGDTVAAGGLTFQVLSTPGHTPGSVCLLCENVLFSGDTLFAGSYGRTDFLGGSSRDMAASLKRLSMLPPETRVLPGHGPSSTIKEELRTNPYLRGVRDRMKLYLKNHTERYPVEQLQLQLFAQEPSEFCTEPFTGDGTVSSLSRGKRYLTATAKVTYQGKTGFAVNRVLLDRADVRATRRILQRSYYLAALQVLPAAPPWGALSGVRPTKLSTKCLMAGGSEKDAEKLLREVYFVSPERARLCVDASRHTVEAAKLLDADDLSVYIGIPFCPTRCAYCSFVSQSIERFGEFLPAYLDALLREIAHTGALLKNSGFHIRTLYMGGGTPTTLSSTQMARLLDAINRNFDLSRCLEFTVEGGRPDTLDLQKLCVIKDGGATRISINPQTMSDKVLEAVGRRHTARQTVEAYEQAVKAGFDDINMDLIAGLPADDAAGFADSIRQVLDLNPSNITVHTLALKKGAALFGSRMELPPQEAVAAMLAGAEDALRQSGYEPYYLYRQKYMSGSFENTGWCRPGYTGLYNIYMMEELHTILSLGGGGMNKINLPEEKLARYHNPKIPQDYISRIDTILQQKDEIFSILRGLREQNP